MSWVLGILAVLAWLLLGLLGLVLLVAALPFRLEAAGAVDSEQETSWGPMAAQARVCGSWAWGVLSVGWSSATGGELRVLGIRVGRFADDEDPAEKARKKREKKAEKKEKKEKKRQKADKKQEQQAKKKKKGRYSIQWGRRHRLTMQRFLGRVWRALRIRLVLRGALGLGDPADTVAVAEALRWFQTLVPGTTLDIDIDYLDELVVLEGALSGRIWLPQLAGIALWELPRRDVRRMLAGR